MKYKYGHTSITYTDAKGNEITEQAWEKLMGRGTPQSTSKIYLLRFPDAPQEVFPITQQLLDTFQAAFPDRSFDAVPLASGCHPVGVALNSPPLVGPGSASPFDLYRQRHVQMSETDRKNVQRLTKVFAGKR
jgi:hypothetical protein